jgi:hypothetical protein
MTIKNLNELLNNNFVKQKDEKKKKLLKEQQELIDNYNKETIEYSELNNLTLNNFYRNYFDNINGIIKDILYGKKWIKGIRLFYIGITLIFFSLIYFIIYNIKNIKIRKPIKIDKKTELKNFDYNNIVDHSKIINKKCNCKKK